MWTLLLGQLFNYPAWYAHGARTVQILPSGRIQQKPRNYCCMGTLHYQTHPCFSIFFTLPTQI